MPFLRNKYSSLDGKTRVAFKEEIPSHGDAFELIADAKGVHFSGKFLIVNQEELQEFAKLLSDVWVDRLSLDPARKLKGTLSGH